MRAWNPSIAAADARSNRLCVVLIALAIWSPFSLLAQMNPEKSGREIPVTRVPFVGCRSDGQTGPLAVPTAAAEMVQIDASAARRLAYYKAQDAPGVLAPRGWYCFGTYGSAGSSLFVAPQPIRRDDLFSPNWRGLTEPAIEVAYIYSGTSGRFEVARIIARLFPAQKAFAQRVIREERELGVPGDDFVFGPYPRDRLTFLTDRIVEYQTPPYCEGLGTDSRLQQNDASIDGVAILQGKTPDLLLLNVRLPPGMNDLTAYVIRQIERNNAVGLSK